MKVGAIYPQTELRGDPKALEAIGRSVEALGYDALVMFDHVGGAEHSGRDPKLFGPYTDKDPFHDPLVAFAYLAGVTRRIELVSGILVLPQRQTLLVARQAADVDLLSDGRLRLGVGVGWNYVEFEALGQDFHSRGRRMDEQVAVLRRLWTDPLVSFDGEFHKLDRLALNPRPNRCIPICCGGVSEAAYRRAARTGDGFIFSGDFETCAAGWRSVQQHLAEDGRPVEGFGADYLLPPGVTPQTARDLIRRWQDLGGTHAAVRTMGLNLSTPAQHIDYLAEVREGLG
jgi:probable F420-dependent oxidoreductase